eukprot:Tamp_21592.p1 GENE.Tamp_21592~~Tamp_21592.p1  ORF type:complete len:122 (-),score=0.59 Tamp_21592:66-431(-)
MARHGADYGVGMPTQYAGGGHNHNALRCSAGQRPLDPRARESASGYWRSAPGEILGTHHGKDLLHGLLGVSLHLGKRRGVSVIADQLREHLVSGADCTHASSPTGVRPWGAYSPNLEQLRA